MKMQIKGAAKPLLFSLLMATALGGCAVYPPYGYGYDAYPYGYGYDGYPYGYGYAPYPYGYGYGYAPAYFGPPVSFDFGFGFYDHGGRHFGGHHSHGGFHGGGGHGGFHGGHGGGRR
jgi:hypothetical protein